MKEMLNGLMLEEYATVPPSTPYYGNPKRYEYDPKKARALLKEAGCLPCKVTFAISTSGSGQMQPLPMNELVKSQMDEAGFEVTLQSMDWNALLQVGRAGAEKISGDQRDQYQPPDAGPVQRADPACLERAEFAEGRQLGARRQPRDGQADQGDLCRVRRREAPRAAATR